jgi:hypothetical protein
MQPFKINIKLSSEFIVSSVLLKPKLKHVIFISKKNNENKEFYSTSL